MALGGTRKAGGAGEVPVPGGDRSQAEQRLVHDVLAASRAADRQRVAERLRGPVEFIDEQSGETLVASDEEDEFQVSERARRVEALGQPRERLLVSALL